MRNPAILSSGGYMKIIITITLSLLLAVSAMAASDAVHVVGDLKVEGIHFAKDGSTMDSANDMLKNKGAWESGTLYSAGDVVQSQGSSYVCTEANTNAIPPNTTYWSLLAAQGPIFNLSDYYTKAEIESRLASVALLTTLTDYYTKAYLDAKFASANSLLSAQSSAPENPVPGQMYFDTITNSPMIYNGSMWSPLRRNISYISAMGPDNADEGYINLRSVFFNKLMSTSRLRITWSDNLRVTGSNVSCQWEVFIDDVATSPQLKPSVYADTGISHRQSTLVGYANGISAGGHTIKIKVSRPLAPTADCYTGWESTFLLEAEEIY